MCATVKRNDPGMRRFLQYLAMHTWVVVVIRDAKTGKIVTQTPKNQMWLNREKSVLDCCVGGWTEHFGFDKFAKLEL